MPGSNEICLCDNPLHGRLAPLSSRGLQAGVLVRATRGSWTPQRAVHTILYHTVSQHITYYPATSCTRRPLCSQQHTKSLTFCGVSNEGLHNNDTIISGASTVSLIRVYLPPNIHQSLPDRLVFPIALDYKTHPTNTWHARAWFDYVLLYIATVIGQPPPSYTLPTNESTSKQ